MRRRAAWDEFSRQQEAAKREGMQTGLAISLLFFQKRLGKLLGMNTTGSKRRLSIWPPLLEMPRQ
jgi:hypothetical protein